MTSRLPGVFVISLSVDCPVCKNLESKGYVDQFLELDTDFVTETVKITIDGVPPPDTPAIFIIDNRYPNFKYFKSVELYEAARVSGRDWLKFASGVRFFNRKVVGEQLVVSQDYVGDWSVDIMKKFCKDSHAQFLQEAQSRDRRPVIRQRYT